MEPRKPNGPVHAVFFVNDSAIMNQTDRHWTIAGSVKSVILKPLRSLDTADVPTFDFDTSCAACEKRTQSFIFCAVAMNRLIKKKKRGDMPPPPPERVANPRSSRSSMQDFRQNTEKMHRATSKDAYAKAWFDIAEVYFHNL